MQEPKTKSSNTAARKPFGPLALYKNRVFLSANDDIEQELISELKTLYRLEDLEVKVVTLTRDKRSKEFRCLEIPGLPRIYLIQLVNHALGIRRVVDVYELSVYDGGSTAIVYVHHSAITLFKLATLHSFPCVLFHNEDEFSSYLESKFIGDDTKEMNFVLAQQQAYVQNEIKFREDFAEHKREAKEQHLQRRQTDREGKKEGKSKDRTPPKGKKTPAKKGPVPKKGQSKQQSHGWEEVRTGRSDKSPEIAVSSPTTTSPEQQSPAKSPVGAYVEALTRPAPREGRTENVKQPTRPEWSLPSDASPIHPTPMVAPVPVQPSNIFGVAPAYPPWQNQNGGGLPPGSIIHQLTPEVIAQVQALQQQGLIPINK